MKRSQAQSAAWWRVIKARFSSYVLDSCYRYSYACSQSNANLNGAGARGLLMVSSITIVMISAVCTVSRPVFFRKGISPELSRDFFNIGNRFRGHVQNFCNHVVGDVLCEKYRIFLLISFSLTNSSTVSPSIIFLINVHSFFEGHILSFPIFVFSIFYCNIKWQKK